MPEKGAAVERALAEQVAKLKEKLDERARKSLEIEREMMEQEKIREVERKIWRRRMGGKTGEEGVA